MAISLCVIVLLAAFIQYGESVRCWTCSSDLNPHCLDPFLYDENNTDILYRYLFFRIENCVANTVAYPELTSSRSACKKEKKYINGDLVVSRGCTWKRQDDFTSACPSSSNGPNEVTYFCETCDYDGCNGAATIGKTNCLIALLLAPLGLLLFK